MDRPFISRTLSYVGPEGEPVMLYDDELMGRSEPLVILGDAGMGKTALLERLSTADGARFVTARKLLREPDPRLLVGDAGCLIIDALDEVPAAKDGEAVDRVLRQLVLAGQPRFILSCRIDDWRSVTATSGIEEDYGAKPLELHIEPFDAEEAERFLSHALTPQRASEVVVHFAELGLGDLLGNPQTLIMVEEVASKGELPDTRGELYERAVAELRREHRPEKADTPLAKLDQGTALDAAGASFATLILTGKEAISRAPSGSVPDSDLHFGDVAALPGGAAVEAMLGSRLFRGTSKGRFFPIHRTVAEHLGARWLAGQADTPRKRRRLLSLFDRDGLVPASLRGTHAWLARDPRLAPKVIATDPIGVILYGDADRLSVGQGSALLAALEALEERNAGFRPDWSTYSIRGFVRVELVDDLRRVIRSAKVGYGLRTLILDALARSPVAEQLADDLRAVLLNPREVYGVRHSAAEALAHATGASIAWPEIVGTMVALDDDNSARLAVALLSIVGLQNFDDRQIAETVFAYGAKPERSLTLGRLYVFNRDLPDARIDGILDLLGVRASQAREDKDEGHHSDDLTDVAMTLIARRLKLGNIDPVRLWRWLEPFDAGRGYHRAAGKEIAEWIKANDEVRRSIQRHVLLDAPGNEDVWQREMRMIRAVPGSLPTPGDVIALLEAFGTPARPSAAEVARWEQVVRLVPHGPNVGADVREAARGFAGSRRGRNQFLDRLAKPRVPRWERNQAKRDEKEERKRRAAFAMHRKSFSAQADKMRAGKFGWVIAPAQAYLGLFRDIEHDDGPLARLDLWLGEELRNAALDGFKKFLTGDNKPSATQIAESHATGHHWPAEWIIVAAMAERQRTGSGFSDLADERLIAGRLVLQFTQIASEAKLEGLEEAIEAELRSRPGGWEAYWRLLVEPQLMAGRDHVDGLYEIVRSERDAALATKLAIEWLDRFPRMSDEAEIELIDRLDRSGAFDELRRIGAGRAAASWRSETQRRDWTAVSLSVNFLHASAELSGMGTREPELLWYLRRRTGYERGEGLARRALTPEQIAWIIREFRASWPSCNLPTGYTRGDTNDWDASEFINWLIKRLGNDASDSAIAEMAALCEAPADGYTPFLLSVAADQARKRVEENYTPPNLDAIRAVVSDAAPTTVADLQATMIEILSEVQRKLDGHRLDWRKGFFKESGQPKGEEACRHDILKMIGDDPLGIDCAPEGHLADDNRADIQCTIGELMLPIEVKGQWHKELWTAAETQLDWKYASDWRADRRGIYLVLWFGR